VVEYQWKGAGPHLCQGQPLSFATYTTSSCDLYFVGTSSEASYIRSYDPAFSATSYNITQWTGTECNGSVSNVEAYDLHRCYRQEDYTWTYNVSCFTPDPARNVLIHDVQYNAGRQCRSASDITFVVNDLLTNYCYSDLTRNADWFLTVSDDGKWINQCFYPLDSNCVSSPGGCKQWAAVGTCTDAGMDDGSDHVFSVPSSL